MRTQSKKYKDPFALAILKIFIYFVNLLLHAQSKKYKDPFAIAFLKIFIYFVNLAARSK